MYTILNIGLAVEGRADNDPDQVVDLLKQVFGETSLRDWRVDLSDTERTVVAKLKLADGYDLGYEFVGKIYRLAYFFGQDCIAVQMGRRGYGELIGPGAKSWGKFNPDFFINID